MMKNSDFYLLLCNVWIVGAFLVSGVFSKILMILMGIAWLVGSVIAGRLEKRQEAEKTANFQRINDDLGIHDKRYYIQDGKVVDREEHRVEGYEEVIRR